MRVVKPNQPAAREWPTFRSTRALPPRALIRSSSGPALFTPVSPALSNLFARLVQSGAVPAERKAWVWEWLRAHAGMWRGAAPAQHAVEVDDTPMVGAVRAWTTRLGVDSDDVLDALGDEVAGGVCLAETEAIARRALQSPDGHPLAWLRALDPVALTESQMRSALRGAARTTLELAAGESSIDAQALAPLDALLLPVAQDPSRTAALKAFVGWVGEQDGQPLTAATVARELCGVPVVQSAEAFVAALRAHGPALYEVIFQFHDGGASRRHAVLLCTAPSANGPWLYDPNQAGFFCGGKMTPERFVEDFVHYLYSLYGADVSWHWTAAYEGLPSSAHAIT